MAQAGRYLTNQLMQSAFGMDAEGYRRYKHLTAANPNLRDHMSGLELAELANKAEDMHNLSTRTPVRTVA